MPVEQNRFSQENSRNLQESKTNQEQTSQLLLHSAQDDLPKSSASLPEKTPANDSNAALSRLEISPDSSDKSKPGTAEKESVISRLENELKEFAQNAPRIDSANIRQLQQLVRDFMIHGDKNRAWNEFSPACLVTKVAMGRDGIGTSKLIEAETANIPRRKQLDQDFSRKTNTFFAQIDKLSKDQKESVLAATQWQDGESSEARQERVRAVLSANPTALARFNAMEEAKRARELSMTPREKELRQRHKEHLEEQRTVFSIARKIEILRDFHLL